MNAAVPNVPDGPVEPSGLPVNDVDTCFSVLKPFSKLALAVSGGADSLCLMVLFSEWKIRNAWTGDAQVIVVDHELRPESADEARFVAGKAGEFGLTCEILHWQGDKPRGNIQEAARRERYRLIGEQMNRTGAEALLLGHHLDDQAETFLDRLTRGSGLYGLSAMAADEPDGPEGLRLLRPLLHVPKARLEASLQERGHTWCSDPSNQDVKYKRSRLRRIMAMLAEEGLSPERIAQTAGHIRRSREALDATVRNIAARHLVEHAAGPVKMAREAYRECAEDLRLRLLSLIIGQVTGRKPRVRLEKLQSVDRMLMSADESRHTLAGAIIQTDRETIWSWREPGRLPPETLVDPAGDGIWDHRYRYSVSCEPALKNRCAGLRLGPLAHAPVRARDIEWPQGWPKEAFACSPAIWNENGEIFRHSSSADFRIGENDRCIALDLVRMPFQGKLVSKYVDDGDQDGEI